MSTKPPLPQHQHLQQGREAARERPSSASVTPAVSIAPTDSLSHVSSAPPENLAIDPVPDPTNDAALHFEWQPVTLGSNQTWGLKVFAMEGAELSAVIQQGLYRKALQGTGTLHVPVIPAASEGTQGTLTIQTTTGATACFTWQWLSPQALARAPTGVSRQVSARSGKAAGTQAGTSSKAARRHRPSAESGRGTAQAQFFGQPAVGHRFAFILDRSNSMEGERWNTCTRELTIALQQLCGQAQVFVVLFSEGILEPPGQSGWTEATTSHIDGVLQWLSSISPDGGTYPTPAFKRVYSLPYKADAIYFLTDGELFDFDAAKCKRLRNNSSGGFFSRLFSPRRDQDDWDPVINTISLDDDTSARELQKMAAESGGNYVHITSASTP